MHPNFFTQGVKGKIVVDGDGLLVSSDIKVGIVIMLDVVDGDGLAVCSDIKVCIVILLDVVSSVVGILVVFEVMGEGLGGVGEGFGKISGNDIQKASLVDIQPQ